MTKPYSIRLTLSNIALIIFLAFTIIVTFLWWFQLKKNFAVYDDFTHKLQTSRLFTLSIILILLAISGIFSYRIFRFYRHNKSTFALETHAWLVIALRYWLAYDNSVYGYAKVFKRFFSHYFDTDDTPVGDLSGIVLAWFFYGYSHEMSLIIAFSQIIGGTLLFFRRTTLLGALILLTVVINIIFINLYYMSLPLAMLNSVLIALGLIYLLALQWDDLKHILWSMYQKAPSVNKPSFKWVTRIALAFCAFITVYYLMDEREFIPISGKWKVERIVKNGVALQENDWLADSNAWKNIYIEANYKVVLSPNPYIYDKKRSKCARFKYDTARKEMQLVFFSNKIATDTVLVSVENTDNKKMVWNTVYRKDKLQLVLLKAEKKKVY